MTDSTQISRLEVESALVLSVILLLVVSAAVGCEGRARAYDPAADNHHDVQVKIDPRIPHLTTFSCQKQCHYKLMPNPTPRELTKFHTTRQIKHGPAVHWCSFCHQIDDIDHLHLIDGTKVSFDESHRLCGQCHGDKHRDWEGGIHGIQTGNWNGVQLRRSCPFCHDPHVPGLPHVVALPPPMRPREAEGVSHEE